MDELNSHGVNDSDVVTIIASGLHRSMTEAELRAKLDSELIRRVETVCHDAWDDNQNQYVGTTSRGTPVWIDKRVVNADLRITVGMVNAHFTAGYGSGAKTILPGVSGYRTVYHNHGVISLDQMARLGVTKGNPAWEDIAEALQFLGPTLAVDVVLNPENETVAAFHGKPVAAQQAGIELYRDIYACKVKERADIVIASCNPEHAYLDQCLKTIVPSSMLVKTGGIRIVASRCQEHLGPAYLRELYYDSLSAGWPDPVEYERMVRAGKFKDSADAVGILKFLQSNNSELTLVSDPSFDTDLKNLKINHTTVVQEALKEATDKFGTDSRVLIMPYGPITLPIP
jgi:nickel-dependent lactate racemase